MSAYCLGRRKVELIRWVGSDPLLFLAIRVETPKEVFQHGSPLDGLGWCRSESGWRLYVGHMLAYDLQ